MTYLDRLLNETMDAPRYQGRHRAQWRPPTWLSRWGVALFAAAALLALVAAFAIAGAR